LGNIEQFFAYIEKYQNLNSQAVQVGEHLQVGIELARMYRNLGFTDKAIKFYNDVIDLGNESGNFPKQVALALHGLGITYMYIEDYNQAIPNFLQAVEIYEKLRRTAKGEVRRDFFANMMSSYTGLSSSYINVNDFQGAYNTIELSRAKLFAERLAESDSLVSIPDLIEVQSSLSSNQAIVIYANVEWKNFIEMVITNDTIISIEVPDSVLLATLYPDNEDATIELAIKSYRNSIKFFAETEKLTEFGRVFFDYLIKPLDEHIQNKTDLLIIPDGILGYLPFEVLIDKNDQYLVENYNITYAQSVSVWDLIRNRKYDQQQATLLAVGGAVYNTQTYKVDMVKNDKMLAYLEKTTFDSISTRGSLRKSYASLGYSDWPNLPGSLEEINSISGVIEYTDKVVGDNATEETIKELSTGGELSKYNMLHFATHGIVVSDMPELSAVVLSQFEDELNDEDGYLTMGEIAELDIKADFVNLSACETGLGKIYSGEGVVGLTQAFMLAGANSVSVSLWPIADKATSEFMVSVYSKIAEGEDYSESINDTKRKFISGKYGEKYKHPYYWAPFVYYGK
jgi:CHAT domain-containing protein